jgi:hypothetical protein
MILGSVDFEKLEAYWWQEAHVISRRIVLETNVFETEIQRNEHFGSRGRDSHAGEPMIFWRIKNVCDLKAGK